MEEFNIENFNKSKFNVDSDFENSDFNYYLPEINEIYVGFEYEFRYLTKELTYVGEEKTHRNTWSEWKKENNPMWIDVHNTNNLNKTVLAKQSPFSSLRKDSSEYQFRVKFLDIEDIKEIGFRPCHKVDEDWTPYKREELYLHVYDGNKTKICIDNGKRFEGREVYFNGHTYNKSQLKQVLKLITDYKPK